MKGLGNDSGELTVLPCNTLFSRLGTEDVLLELVFAVGSVLGKFVGVKNFLLPVLVVERGGEFVGVPH